MDKNIGQKKNEDCCKQWATNNAGVYETETDACLRTEMSKRIQRMNDEDISRLHCLAKHLPL